MTRGYEGDPAATLSAAASLSCRGCHLASEPDRIFARGRVGAPYPRHAGLPPIHLQKLSCTACHSGPRPESAVRRLKTSQSHRLGAQNVNKADDALPHLYYPVFVRQDNGATTPNRLMWPAFWGRVVGGKVKLLAPESVKRVMAKARLALTRSATGSWPVLDNTTLVRVLELLGAAGTHAANAYFVVLRKVFFWVALAAAIPAVGSAMLAMFPLLASVRQPLLFEVHRYAVATLSVSAVVFSACALVAWLRLNPENLEEPARTARSRERV